MDAVLLAGAPLRLEGPPGPVREAAAAMLACLPRARRRDAIPLFAGGETWALPAWLAGAEATDAARLLHGPAGDCAVAHGGLVGVWRPAARELRLFARKRETGLTPLSVSAVLIPLFRELLAAGGKALLHGAALGLPCLHCLSDDGRAALLLADSGGGKTTTALALVRSGCTLLADDLAALELAGGGPRLWGIAEPLNLTPETLRFFPELRNFPDGLVLPNGKRALAADAVYAEAYCHEPRALAALCRIRIGGDAPALEPVPVPEMFGHLLHAHTFAQGQRQHPAAVAACAAALEAAPCFVLHTGPDPLRLGPWLRDALSAL